MSGFFMNGRVDFEQEMAVGQEGAAGDAGNGSVEEQGVVIGHKEG